MGPSFRTPRTSFLCYLGEEASQEEVSCLCGAAAGAGGVHPHTQVMRLQGRVPTWPMWGGLGRAEKSLQAGAQLGQGVCCRRRVGFIL